MAGSFRSALIVVESLAKPTADRNSTASATCSSSVRGTGDNSADYTSTTANGSSTNNWSKVISGPVSTTMTWNAHYESTSASDGLDSSNDRTFTVTFGAAC